ncbi:MAG: response regulator [Chloroflexota bacterium]
MTIDILLVEDHAIVRQGVRMLLESETDLHVVGEASTGIEALHQVEALHPQVIVLDIEIPEVGGLEVLRQIHANHAGVRVVVLSMHAREGYVAEAFKYGVSAYVLKGSQISELVFAIRAAMRGEKYLSQPLSKVSIDAYLEKASANDLDPYETLTTREREVFYLAAEGWSSSEIALRITISSRTVEQYRSNILRKLNLKNQADLVRYAVSRELLPPTGD